jgi:hypothetical protein
MSRFLREPPLRADGRTRDRDGNCGSNRCRRSPDAGARPRGVPEPGRHVVGDADQDHRRLRRRHPAAHFRSDHRRIRDAPGHRLPDHHRRGGHLNVRGAAAKEREIAQASDKDDAELQIAARLDGIVKEWALGELVTVVRGLDRTKTSWLSQNTPKHSRKGRGGGLSAVLTKRSSSASALAPSRPSCSRWARGSASTAKAGSSPSTLRERVQLGRTRHHFWTRSLAAKREVGAVVDHLGARRTKPEERRR